MSLEVPPGSGTCGPKEVPDEPLDGNRPRDRVGFCDAGDRARTARSGVWKYARDHDPRVVRGDARRPVDARRRQHAYDQAVARAEHPRIEWQDHDDDVRHDEEEREVHDHDVDADNDDWVDDDA